MSDHYPPASDPPSSPDPQQVSPEQALPPEGLQPPTGGMAPLLSAPRGAVDLAVTQRQSLWAIAVLAVRTVRQIGLLQIGVFVVFVLSRSPSVFIGLGIGLLAIFAFVVVAALRWLRYTFVVENDELVVHRGVLQRQRLSVPLQRVQSVSLEQQLLHRIFSVVQIKLDTAGSGDAEFMIDAIEKPVAAELQRLVADFRAEADPVAAPAVPTTGADTSAVTPATSSADRLVPAPPVERVLVRNSPLTNLKVALSQTPLAGLALLAPIVAFGDEISDVVPFDLPSLEDLPEGEELLWLVPVIAVITAVVSVVLNIVRVMLADWNLTVSATADGLRRDAGLLSTTSVATPVGRVQTVAESQGLLERFWGIRTVSLTMISPPGITAPGCSVPEATTLRRTALAGYQPAAELNRTVSPLEVFVRVRNAALLAAVIAAGSSQGVGWWALLAFLGPLWVAVEATVQVRRRRWGYDNESLSDFQAFVGWERKDVLFRKANVVTVRQSFFERRRGLATLVLAVSGSESSDRDLKIGMIPLADATYLRDFALRAVETDHRDWM